MNTFNFKCSSCNEIHEGIPTFGANAPLPVFYIPEEEREARVDLGSDDCIIDEKEFYVRGCIEIPVEGFTDPFIWGAWVSLSKESYLLFVEYFEKKQRSQVEPFFGWLCSDFIVYPEQCLNLKTSVSLRDNGIRPYIKVQPSKHLLSIEQENGISKERLIQIYEKVIHSK